MPNILKSLDAWQSYSLVTRLCVPINSYCDNVNVNVTLTVKKGPMLLEATHCLDVVDIHA
jgi:hypothetical protein